MICWRRVVLAGVFWAAQLAAAFLGLLRTFFNTQLVEIISLQLRIGLSVAKFGGYLTNLNAALLLFSMCRALLTRASLTKFGRYLALDVLITMHRLSGYMFVLGATIHVGAHIHNLVVISGQSVGISMAHPTLILGYVLTIILLAIAFTAFSNCIKRRCFEVFRFIHYSWIPMVILLALHGMLCFLKTFSSGQMSWINNSLLGDDSSTFTLDRLDILRHPISSLRLHLQSHRASI